MKLSNPSPSPFSVRSEGRQAATAALFSTRSLLAGSPGSYLLTQLKLLS